MGREPDDKLPSLDAIDPGVVADLKRLVVWQCEAGVPPVRIGIQKPLITALDACGNLLDSTGLSAAELKARLDQVLPHAREGLSGSGMVLYAARAMLGLLDPAPGYDSIVLGSDALTLGNAGANKSTVARQGLRYDTHLQMRKAFVVRLFGGADPSGVKRDSPAATQMAQAVAGALGLATDLSSRPVTPEPSRPHALLSQQLAVRLNESAAGYPAHLTPDVLVESLTLSPLASRLIEQPPSETRSLYADVRSRGGARALDVVSEVRRLIVLGNPGGGKSTVLSAAVVDAARAGRTSLFVRLASFAARGVACRTAEAALALLVELQSEELGVPLTVSSKEVARRLAADPDALIALDGLDEVHADDVERVHNLLRLLAALPGRLVISSRLAGYAAPPGQWQEFTVDSLAPDAAARFIASWFQKRSEGASRAQAALERAAGKALAETPVLLGIIATVAEDDDVPLATPQLYDQYVVHYLRGKWRHRSQWLPAARISAHLAAARRVGWMMATGGTGKTDGTRWSDTISFRALMSDAVDEGGTASLLVERHGLLVPHGRRRSELHQQYRWVHRTVHEHLVGGYLADRVAHGNPVPDDLLMGPSQWDLPLRHMVGLLEEEDARRAFAAIIDLQRQGDPGGVIESVVQRMAFGLPKGSALVIELAQQRAMRGDWYRALELDPSLISSGYIAALERRDGQALLAPLHVLRDYTPTEAAARSLVEVLLATRDHYDASERAHLDDLLTEAIAWLSRDDPDGALTTLIAASAQRYLDPPYLLWRGQTSRDTLVAAVANVAGWTANRRLRYLDFLAELGANLHDYAAPSGPLYPQDVDVAAALSAARRGRDAGDPSPYPLSSEVVQCILSGAYGADAAYEMAFRDDLGGRNKDATGLVPSLVRQVAALYEVEANAGPVADPTEAATLIAELTVSDIRTVGQLPAVLRAMRVVLENASHVPIEQVLRMQWTLAALDDRPRPRPFAASLHWPFNALSDALMKVFASHGRELLAAILDSNPARWVIRQPAWADYSAVFALSQADALAVDEMVALAGWAADADGQMLRFVTQESITEDFITRLNERHSQALQVNHSEAANAMARLGRLAAWRPRFLALSNRDVGRGAVVSRGGRPASVGEFNHGCDQRTGRSM